MCMTVDSETYQSLNEVLDFVNSSRVCFFFQLFLQLIYFFYLHFTYEFIVSVKFLTGGGEN